jgi:hypothetical protein
MGLSMGLVVATAMHGTISGVHLENELIVLSVCLVCSLLHALLAVPLLHGGAPVQVVNIQFTHSFFRPVSTLYDM